MDGIEDRLDSRDFPVIVGVPQSHGSTKNK